MPIWPEPDFSCLAMAACRAWAKRAGAVRQRLCSGHSDLRYQPHGHQEPDGEPGHVDLPPFVPVARRMGIGMMIVVPALAVADEGDKRIVAAIVGRFVIAVPPQMRDRVDRPGKMAMHDGAHDRAP